MPSMSSPAGCTISSSCPNIRERLQRLYGERAVLTLDTADDGATEARVVVPYVVAPERLETPEPVEPSARQEVTA